WRRRHVLLRPDRRRAPAHEPHHPALGLRRHLPVRKRRVCPGPRRHRRPPPPTRPRLPTAARFSSFERRIAAAVGAAVEDGRRVDRPGRRPRRDGARGDRVPLQPGQRLSGWAAATACRRI
ncbi:hypothetical protein HK405_000817, partial [Cladochytrium tenue]